jgi:hypothetical protein
MTIEKILTAIAEYYALNNQVPKVGDMKSVATECYRKVGSWRKALWLAGILPDARRVQLPSLDFLRGDGQRLRLHPNSKKELKRIKSPYPYMKQRVIL